MIVVPQRKEQSYYVRQNSVLPLQQQPGGKCILHHPAASKGSKRGWSREKGQNGQNGQAK